MSKKNIGYDLKHNGTKRDGARINKIDALYLKAANGGNIKQLKVAIKKLLKPGEFVYIER